MQSVVDRVKSELNELVERTRKLSAFLETDEYKQIDIVQQYLLKVQYDCMINYANVLRLRLEAFAAAGQD